MPSSSGASSVLHSNQDMTNKEKYIQFVEQNPTIPLFYQPWWMDTVTQPDHKEWDVVFACNQKGEIEAVMTFVIGRKFGLLYALSPQLTQYTGVWIKDKKGESIKDRLNREKKLQNDIIGQLETMKIAFFNVTFPLNYTYWSPFYWAGYRQETRYTYRIPDLQNTEQVFAGFDYSKQKQIHKAQESGLTIDFEMSADEFYDLQCAQLRERGEGNILSRTIVRSIIDNSRSRGQGLVARAKDKEGHTHAAIVVVWDAHNAWELISAIHPDYRASGASTLVVWEAMKQVAEHTKVWDFEGSMIENVESSFRLFGGVPVPYFRISKQNKLMTLWKACKK